MIGYEHEKTRRRKPAGNVVGQLSKGLLVCATDKTQEDSDHGDDQQYVNDASGVIAEVADSPEYDQDHSDDVKNASHNKCFKVFELKGQIACHRGQGAGGEGFPQ